MQEPVVPSLINEARFFRSGVSRLFSGKPAEFVGELLQNAQRSHASRVEITFPDAETCVIQDNGHGLLQGVESLRMLLTFSESGFADPLVEADQQPLGMGFYALVANERMTTLLLESKTAANERVLRFALDTRRWLDESAYRQSWLTRVQWRDEPEASQGLRITLKGEPSLITDIRACLQATAACQFQTTRGKMALNRHWCQHTMSPACGYADLLDVVVDGQPLDLRLPDELSGKQAQIIDTYQGNPIAITLLPFPDDPTSVQWAGLVVNWYGQLIFHERALGWQAYLHVRSGHPLNPKAPTRAGLREDEALAALLQWAEDRIFGWACEQEQPEVAVVEQLYAIDAKRAEQACPFMVLQPWKPLPAGYTFTSYETYTRQTLWSASGKQGEESDAYGSKQVRRKSELSTLLVLDESVICSLPARDLKQTWRLGESASVQEGSDPFDLVSFGIGITSLLRAIGLTAYQAVVGVPPEQIQQLWWKPGPLVDEYHTLTPGSWGLHAGATPTQAVQITWNPLSLEKGPVFVVGATESYEISDCDWLIALPSTDAMVSFLERAGHAPFWPDEDEPEASIEAYRRSVKALIRAYLGEAIASESELVDLPRLVQPFLPAAYQAERATWRFLVPEGTSKPIGLSLAFPDGYEKKLTLY